MHNFEGALVLATQTWNIGKQELIKGSLYLPYLASESTLSRVDLFIEHLPWEIQHAHCCKSQSKQSYLSVKGIMILFAGKTCS